MLLAIGFYALQCWDLSSRSASKKSCRFSNFLLWLQSVQIPPHLRGQRYNKKLKTESGKRKTFVFRFSLGVEKRNRRCGASAEWACTLCRAARRKSLRSRIKAENGKLLFLDERRKTREMQNAKCRMQNCFQRAPFSDQRERILFNPIQSYYLLRRDNARSL